ncbi:MAG TPA: alanine racemase [Actinomycetota bacterium]|jgi:alanine racemase|nr:alanine racemase [Actinomycetota bacterium]
MNNGPDLDTGALALWAEVDLACIRRNVSRIKGLITPGTLLLAVVKANAYGHGEVEAAGAAIDGGADWLGVARVEEGAALRRAGVDRPILLLAQPPLNALPAAAEYNLTPTIYTEEAARAWSEQAGPSGRLRCHLKVDTGMHRYGVPCEDAGRFIDLMRSLDGVELEGIWTHFAVAEDVSNSFTSQQHKLFGELLDGLGSRTEGLIRHMSNSAGSLTFPEAHLDLVRTGIASYGIYPSPALSETLELEPAMSLKSRVGMVKRLPAGESISYGQRYTLSRDGWVATIPCGYADGLRRALTNSGEVLIRGKRYRISGTITMDHFLVDAGDDELQVGDEVVILGRQGDEEVTAQEMADKLETIPYEVVCGISARVRRVYLNR